MGKFLNSERLFFASVALATVLILIAGVFFLSKGSTLNQEDMGLLVGEESFVLGNSDAKVEIVEFADFQCPACRMAYFEIKKILKEYPDKVKLVYRHFPLRNVHPYALDASQASEAVGEQGEFWNYYSLLFERQNQISKENLREFAKEIGIDLTKFDEAIKNDKYKQKVLADYEAGLNLGVSSTPTFFINGKKYVGVLQYEALRKIVEDELSTK